MFVYDSDKTPAELAAELEDDNEEDDDVDNKSQIDWRYLTATTWLEEMPGIYDAYLKFDDNGNYKKTLVYESDPENPISGDGKYTINKSTNIINLSGLGKYKVVQLTQSTLMLIAELPNGSYPSPTTYHATGSGMPDTPQSSEFAISEPIIENISETSATVKGTIIGEGVTFQERGVCYSTEANPTVNDAVIRTYSDIIKATLTNLYEGTTYYVRLYAKVDGKVTYGEQISFTTTGYAASDIEISASKIGFYQLHLDVKLPNKIKEYGICYGTNPNPLVTDNATTEANRETIAWRLDDLSPNTTYYIRAYHIEGSKVIYYEGSEVEIATLGSNNIDADFSYKDIYLYTTNDIDFVLISGCDVKYNDLPEGFYSAKLKWYGVDTDAVSGESTNGTGSSSSSGILSFNYFTMTNVLISSTWQDRYGRMEGNTKIVIKFTSAETGIIYYCTYKMVYNKNKRKLEFQIDSFYDEYIHDSLLNN